MRPGLLERERGVEAEGAGAGTGAGERKGRTLLLAGGTAGFSPVPASGSTSTWTAFAAGVLTGEEEEGEEEEEEKKLEALDTATWTTLEERKGKGVKQ